MQTKVKVKQRDSSGYRVKPLSIVEQMEVDELVLYFYPQTWQKEMKY